ncbi:aldo/keto reductase family oxidoreductase [Sphingobium nicotianae]|uniref:Aldo/keto reductase family oxidoreductase n=1 Tax=Sphingobium nicotianae TaxID=2782607 RepID=A0A9X1ISX2_9SPHN|nr:aldo/keto reductase family oxidoreductase [Sphingobium nicotianae]MBT2188730.1 aldo/keto reductase family oxidoreductase [Sphingobium nicotianae]
MTDISKAGTYRIGSLTVKRMGYGAMQLAGPGVFGPPKDRAAAIRVLRDAVAAGVDHIDTCDYYGPHVTNQIIREALHPYPDNLVLVSKVGARRGSDGSWIPAQSPDELISAVHDNLRNLGIEQIHAVNLRLMGGADHGPSEESLEERYTVMAKLQEQGLIRELGISTVTPAQIAEAQSIAPLACVQNHYNLVHRADDAMIDDLARQGIAYVPYFPLGGFQTIQTEALSAIAAKIGLSPLQVAQAWLLARSPNILLIPGTSSPVHLQENLAAAEVVLSAQTLAELETIAASGVH